jgi:hypothetical protein
MSRQDEIAARVRTALHMRDVAGLSDVFSDDAQFASCVGRAQIMEYLTRVLARIRVDACVIEAHADRLIVVLDVTASEEGDTGARRQYAVLFVRNDIIFELRMTGDRETAVSCAPSPPAPARPNQPTRLKELAAILPVRNLGIALEHYRLLGFSVHEYPGGGYGFAERDGLNLHFSVVSDLNPAATTSAIYLYVDDADLLYAEWRSSGVSGQFFPPHDTEYGLREGGHVDRDGNLIRFGSPV